MIVGIDCRLINKTQNTGISRYTEFLINYYIDRYGDENIFLISNDKSFKYSNCSIIYTKLKPFNILHFLQFSTFVKKLNLNLLHVPFYSALFVKNLNLKVIVTVHDLMYKFVENFFGNNKILNNLKIKYFDFIVTKSLLSADTIVSVSDTTKNDVHRIFGLKSIRVAEYSEIQGNKDFSILEKFNLNHKSFYFYCGNNRSHKNIDFICEVFKNNADLPPLVLAGKGHHDNKNIITTGIVSEEELKALYESAIAFVFPSKYEGFGLPILESLRLNTIVIASKIPAFLEFNSPNILYFDLDSKDEFICAVKTALFYNFKIDESFFTQFNKNKIYESYDRIINDFNLNK
jgi:glycosyltransferase involved in cell wall biosynthesis